MAPVCRDCHKDNEENNAMPHHDPDPDNPIQHGVIFRIDHPDFTTGRTIINKLYQELLDYCEATGAKLVEHLTIAGGEVEVRAERTKDWKRNEPEPTATPSTQGAK